MIGYLQTTSAIFYVFC